MRTTPKYVTIWLLAWLLAGVQELSGQILDAVPGTPTENIRFQVSEFPDLYSFYDDHETHYPYWQIFWMYGDGNYYYNKHDELGFIGSVELPPPASPYEFPNLFLPAPLSYDPAALLIDRKTDNPPPSVANIVFPNPGSITTPIPVNVTPTGTHPSGLDFIEFSTSSPAQLPMGSGTCARVSLENSHFIDSSRWTGFIPAFKPLPQPGKLLFFFDQNAGGPLFAPDFETFGPRYGPVDLVDHSLVQPAANYAIPPGSGTYGRVLRYDIPDDGPQSLWFIDNLNDDKEEELRLFHFLKALEIMPGTPLEFMVMLVTNDPPDPKFSTCINSNYGDDIGFISNYVDGFKTIRYNDTTYYYVDADTIQLKGGEPKDPNHLVVTNIRGCSNSNLFEVTFELTFCNESRWVTNSASVFIEDLTGGHIRCFSANGVQPGIAILTPAEAGCSPLHANYDCSGRINFQENRNGNFCLTYDPISTSLAEDCRTFTFTAITNLSGVKLIQQGKAVRACVNFHETRCETMCAISDSTQIDPFRNLPWEPCPDCCFSFLCRYGIIGGIVLVVVAAFILLWYKGWPPFRPKKQRIS